MRALGLNRRIGARAALASLVALMVAANGVPSARADAVFTVGCSVPDLISAFNQADTAGSGTINLAPGCTYTFIAPDNTDSTGGNALPVIAGLTGPLTINGNGATLQRSTAAGTPAFRLLELGQAGQQLGVTIDDLTITGGSVTGTGEGGGGIYAPGNGLTLADDTISGNSAAVCGGGVDAPGAKGLVIRGSTISSNLQTSTSPRGCGGILGGGAGLFVNEDTQITGSVITGNTAAFGGGGLSVDASGIGGTGPNDTSHLILLSNDTIVDNQAPNRDAFLDGGGGIWSDADTVLVNDTIADDPGGALVWGGGDESTVGVYFAQSSIIDGSCKLAPSQEVYSLGSNAAIAACPLSVVAGSNKAATWCPPAGCAPDASGVTSTSTGLGPLTDNGGPTHSEAIGPDSPAYRLEPAGDCPATDQRGVARPQAGASDCNAGAYETQAVATALAYNGPTSGTDGTSLTLSATLTHPSPAIGVATAAGGPVAGQAVSLQFGGESCTATTDASGTAACSVTPTDSPSGDPYPITARYLGGPTGTGTDVYLPSSDTSHTFSVTPTPTSPAATVSQTPTSLAASPQLVLFPSPKGVGLGQLSATLTGGGSPLAGRTVSFSAGGKALCTAVTNARGIARCRVGELAEQRVLRFNRYTARFTGSDDQKASLATTQVVELGSWIAHGEGESQHSIRASGTLMRGHRIYARLVTRRAHGDVRLALDSVRRLQPGRYTLTVNVSSGRRAQRTIRIAVAVFS